MALGTFHGVGMLIGCQVEGSGEGEVETEGRGEAAIEVDGGGARCELDGDRVRTMGEDSLRRCDGGAMKGFEGDAGSMFGLHPSVKSNQRTPMRTAMRYATALMSLASAAKKWAIEFRLFGSMETGPNLIYVLVLI